MPNGSNRCEWLGLTRALKIFVRATEGVQGSAHIKPLHWYVASRLVVEGGFDPDEVVPHPPFRIETRSGMRYLHHDPTVATAGERTVLGGLKTKDVDVTVAKSGIGPCVAVSLKGTLNAYRNLTNRMEEAVGDCTNLHIAYPTLVCAYLNALRANRPGPIPENGRHFLKPDVRGNVLNADLAIREDGKPSEGIVRYHAALRELTNRRGIRNEVSKYEAVCLALVESAGPNEGEILQDFPPKDSPLLFDLFFAKIYLAYDERYVYGAPALRSVTGRRFWHGDSPALRASTMSELDYAPRFADA